MTIDAREYEIVARRIQTKRRGFKIVRLEPRLAAALVRCGHLICIIQLGSMLPPHEIAKIGPHYFFAKLLQVPPLKARKISPQAGGT